MDRAIRTWGTWITSQVEERDTFGNKIYQSVGDILMRFDPETGQPGPIDPEKWVQGELGAKDLVAFGLTLRTMKDMKEQTG